MFIHLQASSLTICMEDKKVSSNIAVENLKRIWNIRKREMDITQVEAAEKLNWTQGAFSQYLNAITEMSPQTIIKLANFLDVDPIEIDPDIDKSLPDVTTYPITHNLSDPTIKANKTLTYHNVITLQFVTVDKEMELLKDNGLSPPAKYPAGAQIGYINMFDSPSYAPKMTSSPNYYLIQKKNAKVFETCEQEHLPSDEKLVKKFLIIEIVIH